jgi:hypothetical protein
MKLDSTAARGRLHRSVRPVRQPQPTLAGATLAWNASLLVIESETYARRPVDWPAAPQLLAKEGIAWLGAFAGGTREAAP